MKRRSLTVLLCLLAIISLASVGFASWVISAGDEVEATGNIQVETVSDQRLLVTVTSGKDEKINLLAPSADVEGITNPWLYSNNTLGGEDLSATIKFSVTYSDTKNAGTPNATCSAAWDKATSDLLKSANAAGYLGDPSFFISSGEITSGSGTVTITFQWGKAFEGKNPYEFYNNLNVNDGYYSDGNCIIFKETTPSGVVYKQYASEANPSGGSGLYEKVEITKIPNGTQLAITEDNLEAANYIFTSWADDAKAKLEALYTMFAPTDAGLATFGVVITVSPERQ